MISREPAELARAAHSLGARIKTRSPSAGLACEIKLQGYFPVLGGDISRMQPPTTLVCLRQKLRAPEIAGSIAGLRTAACGTPARNDAFAWTHALCTRMTIEK